MSIFGIILVLTTATDPLVPNFQYDNPAVEYPPILRSINDNNLATWRLGLRTGDEGASYSIVAEGSQNVTRHAAYTFDPTLLLNGLYKLTLEATDVNGETSTDTINLIVEGEMKVRNFSFTVVDLEIPLSGIPIRVTRTYDTRQKQQNLDFCENMCILVLVFRRNTQYRMWWAT